MAPEDLDALTKRVRLSPADTSLWPPLLHAFTRVGRLDEGVDQLLDAAGETLQRGDLRAALARTLVRLDYGVGRRPDVGASSSLIRVALSPCGRYLAQIHSGGALCLRSGEAFRDRVLLPFPARVGSRAPQGLILVRFSDDSSRLLACVRLDGSGQRYELLRLDLATRRWLPALPIEDRGSPLALSADGDRLLVTDEEGLRVLDPAAPRQDTRLLPLPEGYEAFGAHAAFAPDGRTLAAVAQRRSDEGRGSDPQEPVCGVVCVDASTGTLLAALPPQSGPVSLAWSPSSGTLAVAAGLRRERASLALFRAPGLEVDRELPGFSPGYWSSTLTWLSEEELVVATRRGLEVHPRRGRDPRPHVLLDLRPRAGPVTAPRARTVAVWTPGEIVTVDPDSGHLQGFPAANRAPLHQVAWTPDGGRILTRDRTSPLATVWDTADGRRVGSLVIPPLQVPLARLAELEVRFHAEVYGTPQEVRVVDRRTGEVLVATRLERALPVLAPECFLLSPESRRLLVLGSPSTHGVGLWDLDSGALVEVLELREHFRSVKVDLLPGSGAFVLHRPEEGVLTVHDLERGREVERHATGRDGEGADLRPAQRILEFPGGEALLCVLPHGLERVDRETGTRTRLGPSGLPPAALALSPDGRWISRATRAGAIQLLDARTGAQVHEDVRPGEVRKPIADLAWSPDGARLAYLERSWVRFADPKVGV